MNAMFALVLIVAAPSSTEKKPDFGGSWEFDVKRSTNVSMMAMMRLTETVEQNDGSLIEHDRSVINGQEQKRDVTYDLTAKATPNASPMGDACITVTHWRDGTLVTEWTSEGAVAGSKVTRIETRSLSPDAQTMTVESRRGENPPIVMVFVRK